MSIVHIARTCSPSSVPNAGSENVASGAYSVFIDAASPASNAS